jgi:ADP-ribose pyrophosphatase YjhB (NUDIX family)
MKELDELRAEVDAADEAILAALNRRFAASDRIRGLKARAGLPRVDAEREREILAMAAAAVPAAKRDVACAVFEKILGGSRGEIETIARGVCVRDGSVLLCRAKGAQTTYLPGGHIEFGETGAEALVREMKEETGLDVRAGNLLGVLENSFLQHGEKHCEINLVYAMELSEGAAGEVASREEWIEFEWRQVNDIASANLLPAEIAKFIPEPHS